MSCLRRRLRSSLWVVRCHGGRSMTLFGVMHTASPSPFHRLAEAIKYSSNDKLKLVMESPVPLSEGGLLRLTRNAAAMQAYLLRNVRKSQDSTPIDESTAIDAARKVKDANSECKRGTRRAASIRGASANHAAG